MVDTKISDQLKTHDDPEHTEEDAAAAYDYAAMVKFGATNGFTELPEE